jgi:hypothetical protein
MRKNVFYYLSAFLIVFAAGCSETADVEPTVDQDALNETLAAEVAESEENLRRNQRAHMLQNVKVAGEVTDLAGEVTTDNFLVTITSFSYDEEKGLLASGTIANAEGTISGTFEDVEATLAEGSGSANARVERRCQVLFLDLGPIFLDVLGLEVDLSQIVLDLTAVSGSGNLLGNLLCAVVGLLDPITGLTDFLGALTSLLDRINNLLG